MPLEHDGKSFASKDPVVRYCTEISVRADPLQKELAKITIEQSPESIMLGAPEVLQFGANFIKLIGAKRVLDIGTFTGASALAWALALPENGHVLTMDVSHEHYDQFGRALLEKRKEIVKKIEFHCGQALEKMDQLLAGGEAGKWDFAFIDADKPNYTNYYERCVKLLRSGGVIFIDNALWSDSVVHPEKVANDEKTRIIDATNRRIHADDRVMNMLLAIGDGTHVIFKK